MDSISVGSSGAFKRIDGDVKPAVAEELEVRLNMSKGGDLGGKPSAGGADEGRGSREDGREWKSCRFGDQRGKPMKPVPSIRSWRTP